MGNIALSLPVLKDVCKITSVVYWPILIKFGTVLRCPVSVVTICPREMRGEGGKEVAECPGHYDVVVSVEKENDD